MCWGGSMYVCICVCVPVEARCQPELSSSVTFHLIFWGGLQRNLELTDLARISGYLASEPQGPSLHHLPVLEHRHTPLGYHTLLHASFHTHAGHPHPGPRTLPNELSLWVSVSVHTGVEVREQHQVSVSLVVIHFGFWNSLLTSLVLFQAGKGNLSMSFSNLLSSAFFSF